MNGSNGNVAELLERLIAENVATRELLTTGFAQVNQNLVQTNLDIAKLRKDMNEGFAAVNARVDQTNVDMNKGFAAVNARIDNVLRIAGGRHDDHEERIVVLEEHVLGKKSG